MQLQEVKKYIEKNSKKGILSVDPGAKKIGIAWADYDIAVPIPIEVIKIDSLTKVINKIKAIASEKEVVLIIFGTNVYNNHANNTIIVKFREMLEEQTGLPIFNEDESFSTKMAHSILKMYDIKHKKICSVDDMVATMLILEAFLRKIKSNVI